MSARIINFEEARTNRGLSRARMIGTNQQTDVAESEELMQRFQFWTGASGDRYVHTIYTLVDCPALTTGNVILVKRDKAGQRTALDVGILGPNSPSLNLAEIRQRGATMGANEVHVHLLAESHREARRIAFDLQTGHCDEADPAMVTQH